jgi:hypothetical protein
MLGTYGKDFPFYLLSVPNGTNVWGEVAKKTLNGKFDMNNAPQHFTATGKFYLPSKTKVMLSAGPAVNVTIDGKGYDLSNYDGANSAQVELNAGLHTIKLDVENNGGQLPGCSVKITNPSGQFELPIFVTQNDIAAFVKTLPKGAIEISGWDTRKTRLTTSM